MSLSLRNIITSIKGRSGLQITRILARSNGAVLWEAIRDVISVTSWSGDLKVTDSPRSNGDGATDGTNNCSTAINATGYNTLVWTGTTERIGTYGESDAYIRGGSSVGGTNYFNILIRSTKYGDTNDVVSFSQTIDISGISGNLYLSVYVYAIGGSDDGNWVSEVGTQVDTKSITIKV